MAGGLPLEFAPAELYLSRCRRFPDLQHDFVSVVARRAEIGIVRALGASRGVILPRSLAKPLFGIVARFSGLPLGRFMATGAVG